MRQYFRSVTESSGFFEQVRAANIADKQKITREETVIPAICDLENQVFGRVAGCMDHRKLHIAHAEGVAVIEQRHRVVIQPSVLPTLAALTREQKHCACACAQFARAAGEICMDVGFSHGGDGQAVRFGGV